MLVMEDVRHSFDKRPVLKGVNLYVPEGSTTVIMGPSGCGKSTILRTINRMVKPDAGRITWKGEDLLKMSSGEVEKFRKKVGFVFQRSNLIGRLNVIENVMFPMVVRGSDNDKAFLEAKEALKSVGMYSKAENNVKTLSGGEMQRVAIARAITGHPELILWDEPTSSLDPMMVLEVLNLMETIASSFKTTMLVVTHEMNFAMRCCDKVAFMDDGRIVEEGAPYEMFTSPVSSVGERYAQLFRYRNEDTMYGKDVDLYVN